MMMNPLPFSQDPPSTSRYDSIMKFSSAITGLVLAALAGSALSGATYSLSDSIVGEDFYNAFTFVTVSDPLHGRV